MDIQVLFCIMIRKFQFKCSGYCFSDKINSLRNLLLEKIQGIVDFHFLMSSIAGPKKICISQELLPDRGPSEEF